MQMTLGSENLWPSLQAMSSPSCSIYRQLRPTKILDVSDGTFTVLSYNLLAQHHIWPDSLPYSPTRPKGCLRLHARMARLKDELLAYLPDVGGLQEVSAYKSSLQPLLQSLGYSSFFQEKGQDGLVVFYRTSQFTCLSYEFIQLPIPADQSDSIPNIAQFIKLKTLDREFLLINTHLYWRWDYEETRLDQLDLILSRIQDDKLNRSCVILLGDLNSNPSSLLYKRLASKFESVYSRHEHPSGEPAWTNYTADFKSCLDYIWITPHNIKPVSLLKMPAGEVLNEQVALPNEIFLSDHLALVCQLKLIN